MLVVVYIACTHCVEKAATAKVARKPGKSFIDLCPDLQVSGIPVIRELKLPTDVAEDGNTTTHNMYAHSEGCNTTTHNMVKDAVAATHNMYAHSEGWQHCNTQHTRT